MPNVCVTVFVAECRCEGQKVCAITASNSIFGDSCVNTGKYLEVIYQCEGMVRT